MFIFILFLTTWSLASAKNESLFSLACSHDNQACSLYRIDIDQSSNRTISNEVAKWNQANIADGFGSMAGFKNGKMPYIVFTANCNNHAHLINITNLTQSPLPINMKTFCTQPIHSLADRYLLALGTTSNNVGGSSPVSLYVFDAISGHWTRDIVNFGDTFTDLYQVLHPQTGFSAINFNAVEPTFYVILYNLVNDTRHILIINIETGQWTLKQIENNLLRNFAYSTELNAPVSECSMGGICVLNLESYQWDLFLSIPNFQGFIDWTFSNDQQMMYFISEQNVTLVDLSNKSSFHYRVLPLIKQTGDINNIDKTVVFDD